MKNPWMKFYPRDWRGEHNLRAVSIAARGLWIECLCIMHEAKPYGHLMLNGKPIEDDTLARMAGIPVDDVRSLMAELQQAGVFSLTRKGVVFSRRMTKDHSRSIKGRKAVEKRHRQGTENKQKTGEPNRLPNRLPITQKPEARTTTTARETDWKARLDELQRHAGQGLNPQSFDLERWDHPQAWEEAGCDWTRDVLPTVERLGSRAKPGSIKSWRYFSDAVIEARDKRQGATVASQPAGQTGRSPADLDHSDWLIRIANADRIWPEEYGPKPANLDGTDDQKASYYLDLHATRRRAVG